ncbi:MAG: hypothetical protein MHM6MM_000110 [Cercozoa sp. M6MM]
MWLRKSIEKLIGNAWWGGRSESFLVLLRRACHVRTPNAEEQEFLRVLARVSKAVETCLTEKASATELAALTLLLLILEHIRCRGRSTYRMNVRAGNSFLLSCQRKMSIVPLATPTNDTSEFCDDVGSETEAVDLLARAAEITNSWSLWQRWSFYEMFREQSAHLLPLFQQVFLALISAPPSRATTTVCAILSVMPAFPLEEDPMDQANLASTQLFLETSKAIRTPDDDTLLFTIRAHCLKHVTDDAIVSALQNDSQKDRLFRVLIEADPSLCVHVNTVHALHTRIVIFGRLGPEKVTTYLPWLCRNPSLAAQALSQDFGSRRFIIVAVVDVHVVCEILFATSRTRLQDTLKRHAILRCELLIPSETLESRNDEKKFGVLYEIDRLLHQFLETQRLPFRTSHRMRSSRAAACYLALFGNEPLLEDQGLDASMARSKWTQAVQQEVFPLVRAMKPDLYEDVCFRIAEMACGDWQQLLRFHKADDGLGNTFAGLSIGDPHAIARKHAQSKMMQRMQALWEKQQQQQQRLEE